MPIGFLKKAAKLSPGYQIAKTLGKGVQNAKKGGWKSKILAGAGGLGGIALLGLLGGDKAAKAPEGTYPQGMVR